MKFLHPKQIFYFISFDEIKQDVEMCLFTRIIINIQKVVKSKTDTMQDNVVCNER